MLSAIRQWMRKLSRLDQPLSREEVVRRVICDLRKRDPAAAVFAERMVERPLMGRRSSEPRLSRIGGSMRGDVAAPCGGSGEPMTLVFTLSLAEALAASNEPKIVSHLVRHFGETSLIHFFYGDDTSCEVIVAPQLGSVAFNEPTPCDDGCVPVALTQTVGLPMGGINPEIWSRFGEDTADCIQLAANSDDDAVLFGWPVVDWIYTVNVLAARRAGHELETDLTDKQFLEIFYDQADRWVCLLRLGCDLGFDWEDAGILQFCIHIDDLHRGDLSKTQLEIWSS